VDYLRNGRGATAVAAYSARARPGATVSTPLAWEELGPEMRPDRFSVLNLLHRLAHIDDPWKDMRKQARRLPA
jgi:bifunctional non-homologous end joining protein LigD